MYRLLIGKEELKKSLTNKFFKLSLISSLFLSVPLSAAPLKVGDNPKEDNLAIEIGDAYLDENGAPGFLLNKNYMKKFLLRSSVCPNRYGIIYFPATNSIQTLHKTGRIDDASVIYINAVIDIDTYDVVYLTSHNSFNSSKISFKKNNNVFNDYFKCNL